MSNLITLVAGTTPVEGGMIGTYLVTLTTPAPVGGLTVNFNTLGSTATLNSDYNFALGANLTAVSANSFTIAEGASSATLNLVAHADAMLDPNETVTLNLTTGTGYQLAQDNGIRFSLERDYAVDSYPQSVDTGDFNNDGKLDLVVTSGQSGYVSVLLRKADNTGFDAKIDYPIGLFSGSEIGVGDFNNDGKLDLAVSYGGSYEGNVSVLLRNADNTGFDAKVDYTTGLRPVSVSVADFNNDGKLDLAVANYISNTVSVLLRNADNTGFDTKVDYTTGSYPISVGTGDFNNDGKLDLAVANYGSDTVSVLLRNADNTGFDAKFDYTTGVRPVSVSVADFNSDGKLDLAVANFYSDTVSVFLRNADNTDFNAKVDYATGYYPRSISEGDFNNDGKTDLAVTNEGANAVSVLWRNADNTGFNTKVDYITGVYPTSVSAGDFNNDGKLDLATANWQDSTVSVLLNNSNPTATLTIASNDAPVLSAPTTINYIDTIFDDSFATVTGVLVASDIDGDSLTYGIAGGADNGDGTISKSNDYGKLIVNKITADYSFIPNKAGIERLTLVENSNFTVTVSDGRFSDSQALSINIERVGSDSSDRLTGTAGDDVLNGLAGNDTIYALAGDDRINGGEGADKMLGGKGDDTYYVDNVDDKVIEHKGEGVDTVHSTARSFTLPANVENLFIDSFSYVGSGMTGIGNSLDNYMTSGYSNNTIYGLAGNDSLYGHTAKSGQNILVGGTGDDSYYVGGYVDANDIIIENKNEGEDTVYATASCTLSDNVENLVLVGDRTDRGIFRGTGNELNNHLTGSGTQSVLEGLGGNDNYYVGNEGTVIVESANNGWDTVLSTTNRTLEANVEELYLLGTANLYGRGNEQDNNLNGNVGNNMLDGRGGADFMQGGAGDDTYYVDNAGDVVKERAGEGLDTVNSRVSYTLSANVENLTINLERAASPILVGTGNELDNHLKADGRIEISAHAILEGMAGNDTLDSNIRCSSIMLGGEGNDFYYIYNVGDTVTEYANQGIDTVNSGLDSYTLTANVENLILGPIPFIGISASSGTGNELANRLTGNRANNTLDGKAGDDILVGGDGADLLIGGLGKDSYDLNETTVATDTVRIAKGDSLVSTYDMATGFQLGMSALDNLGVDKLDLDSSKIAANANAVDGKNSGNIKSHHISDGIISFDDVNHYVNPLAITQTDLSNVFSYLQANITNNDTVAFVSQGNTFVFQDGGTTDTLVELVGVVAHSIDTSGLAAGAVWIV